MHRKPSTPLSPPLLYADALLWRPHCPLGQSSLDIYGDDGAALTGGGGGGEQPRLWWKLTPKFYELAVKVNWTVQRMAMRRLSPGVPHTPAVLKARERLAQLRVKEQQAVEFENFARQKANEAREAMKKAKKALAEATLAQALV